MTAQQTNETRPLRAEEVRLMDVCWRAANYLSVGQVSLFDNPLLVAFMHFFWFFVPLGYMLAVVPLLSS